MADDMDFVDATQVEEAEFAGDPIAQRADAYRRLMAEVARLPRGQREMRAEGMMMLRAVRMSFRLAPQAELSVVRSQNGPLSRSGS
jgi:hypothetical protein